MKNIKEGWANDKFGTIMDLLVWAMVMAGVLLWVGEQLLP